MEKHSYCESTIHRGGASMQWLSRNQMCLAEVMRNVASEHSAPYGLPVRGRLVVPATHSWADRFLANKFSTIGSNPIKKGIILVAFSSTPESLAQIVRSFSVDGFLVRGVGCARLVVGDGFRKFDDFVWQGLLNNVDQPFIPIRSCQIVYTQP